MARMKVYAVVQCYDCYGDHESVVQLHAEQENAEKAAETLAKEYEADYVPMGQYLPTGFACADHFTVKEMMVLP